MVLVGIRIRELRKSKGVKQTWLAHQLGISRGTLATIEKGSDPKASIVRSVALLFDVSADYLLDIYQHVPPTSWETH